MEVVANDGNDGTDPLVLSTRYYEKGKFQMTGFRAKSQVGSDLWAFWIAVCK